MIPEPPMPTVNEWILVEKLNKEKEVTGIYISGHPLDDYKLEIRNFTNCSLDEIEKHKNQEVTVAGIVTMANHRISKKGSGWGDFMIQDFNESLNIRMFGEGYVTFKHYFEMGNVLHIKGKYQPRWNSQDEFEFRVKEIQLLEEVGKNMTESITIKINIDKLTDDMVYELSLIHI